MCENVTTTQPVPNPAAAELRPAQIPVFIPLLEK